MATGRVILASTTRPRRLSCGWSSSDRAYVDQVDSATDEEEPLSDLDLSDDLRVEDEDWEIAERGLPFF